VVQLLIAARCGKRVLLVRRPLVLQWTSSIASTFMDSATVDGKVSVPILVHEHHIGASIPRAQGLHSGLVKATTAPGHVSEYPAWVIRMAYAVLVRAMYVA